MLYSKQLKHWKIILQNWNSRKLDFGRFFTPLHDRHFHLSRVNCRFCHTEDSNRRRDFSDKLDKGPSLQHFIANSSGSIDNYVHEGIEEKVPYLEDEVYSGNGRKGMSDYNTMRSYIYIVHISTESAFICFKVSKQ